MFESMSGFTFICLLIAIPFVTIGTYIFTKGSAKLKELRQITLNAIISIADLRTDMTEVAGKVVSAPAIKSPLQVSECVAYYYTIERYMLSTRMYGNPVTHGGLSSQQMEDSELEHYGEPDIRHWVVVAEESSSLPFVIEDGTGQVIIQPKGCKMHFGRQYQYESDAPDGDRFLPDAIRSLVKEKGLNVNALMKYREWIIMQGDQVFVSGIARERGVSTTSGVQGHLVFPELKFEIGRSDSVELFISDLSKRRIQRTLVWAGWSRVIGGLLLSLAAMILFLFAALQR